MSENAVIQFLRELSEDDALQAKVEGVTDFKELRRIAVLTKDKGFTFTAEEWTVGVKLVKNRRNEIESFVKNTGGSLPIPKEVSGLDYISESLLN